MCTKEETKLFIETVNSIPTREMPHLDIEFFDEADFIDQFPTKDRSKSRARYHASKRDKAKHFNKKEIAYQREYDLYLSGMDTNGNTHKAQFLKDREKSEMRDFQLSNGNENYKNYKAFKKYTDFSDLLKTEEELLAEDIMNVFDWYTDDFSNSVMETIEDLQKNGIEIYSNELNEFCNTYFAEKSRRERKLQIDNERPIIGYSVYLHDYPNALKRTYLTREMAEDVIKFIVNKFPELEHDYCILPVRTYTEEQVREIKSLGFLPVAGIMEV